jgi:hypothetical protein
MDNKENTFICAICGKEHESVLERAKCEIECAKKKEESEKRAAAEKKVAEKKLRKEAVDEAVANAFRLINAYTDDYGSYEYDTNIIKECVWPSRIWHYFG